MFHLFLSALLRAVECFICPGMSFAGPVPTPIYTMNLGDAVHYTPAIAQDGSLPGHPLLPVLFLPAVAASV